MALPFWCNSTLRAFLAGVVAALVAACAAPPTGKPRPPTVPTPPRLVAVDWAELPGWPEDDLKAAWPVLLRSCRVLDRDPNWHPLCAEARSTDPEGAVLRQFFEEHFVPYRVENDSGTDTGLITGYFEPQLTGSRTREAPYTVPLFGVPSDLIDVELSSLYPQLKGMRLRGRLEGNTLVPYAPRSEIESAPGLAGKEIAWVEDRVAAFFMEVQGSGRVHLIDNGHDAGTIRLSYADQNGYPYRAIGRWLVEHDEMKLEDVSMQSIIAWTRAHPERVDELLFTNPSYVFFKEAPIEDPALGPNGALGVPLTPGRSIAVDPRVVKLGAPVYLATTLPAGRGDLRRLMLAQDTGGAITASHDRPVRADVFFGSGDPAAELAGAMKQSGRMWVLLPRTSGANR